MKFNPDMSFPFVLCVVEMISMKLFCGTKVQISASHVKQKRHKILEVEISSILIW